MTEKRLAKFIETNHVTLRLYDHNGVEYNTFDDVPEEMSDFEWEQWTMFMDVYAYDLDSLSHILGHEFFKHGVQIVWHHGHVSIDLKDIIEYFDLNYKKIA